MKSINNQVKQRNRGANFSPTEVRVLMDLTFKFRDIIENKKTYAITSKERNIAWTTITDLFNAANGVATRSSKTLRGKYESIKKKKAAHNRQELNKTNGGQATQTIFSVPDEKVLAAGGNIDGLDARNDSDALVACTSTTFIPDTIEETSQVILSDEANNNSRNTKPIGPNIQDKLYNDTDSSWFKWQTRTPRDLKTKTNPAFKENPSKTSVKIDGLAVSRLQLVELQKEIAQNEIKYKQIEHELHILQRQEEHEIRILYLTNEEKRRQEEHQFKLRGFNK